MSRLVLAYYDRLQRIQWTWQALDSKTVPAPLGGEQTSKNPTDRGKYGSKRHVLVDGRGAPLSVIISAANTHDSRCALATLESDADQETQAVTSRASSVCRQSL
ncbi:MAG: transposase [Thermoflexales bacterium]